MPKLNGKEDKVATGKNREQLISFETGHYKKVTGEWSGDSVWGHFKKDSGGMVHVNKDKVEYIETFGNPVPAVEMPSNPQPVNGTEVIGISRAYIENLERSYKELMQSKQKPAMPKRSHHKK